MTEDQIANQVKQVWEELKIKQEKVWSRTDINAAKRATFEANVLIHNPAHEHLLIRLCDVFEVNIETARQKLFATDVFEKSATYLAHVVAQAILYGPRVGIEPFVSLHQQGALPGQTALIEKLHPQLNGSPLVAESVFPASVPAGDRPMLKRLFVQVGLSGDEARQCADSLCPSQTLNLKPRRNTSEKKCLEQFVIALHQPDICPNKIEVGEIMKRLKRFGLSKRGYYAARNKTFAARSLKATTENRRQIEQMAKALKRDAGKFIQNILEGK